MQVRERFFQSLVRPCRRVFRQIGRPADNSPRLCDARIHLSPKLLLLFGLGTLNVSGPALAQLDSIDEKYTVPFVRHLPNNVDEAISSFAARARPVVNYLACARDIDLYHWMVEQTRPHE